MVTSKGPLRRAVRGALRTLAALALALVLTEIAFRALGLGLPPRGPNNALPGLEMAIPEAVAPGLGRSLRPGGTGEVLYPGHGGEPDRVVSYRVSSQGFRDRERAVPKPPGVFRIAVLGDSMTFGTGVQQAETYPDQLEALIAERGGHGAVEVVNCGVYATNTLQQVAWLEHAVLALQPDLVLITSTVVDASGLGIPPPPPREGTPWEVVWTRRLGLTSGVWEAGEEQTRAHEVTMWLRRRSRVCDTLCHHLYRWLYGRVSTRNYHEDWAEGSAGRAAIERGLARAAELAVEREFALHVAMYPALTDLSESYPFSAEIEVLEEICARHGIPFHDLLPALKGLDARALRAHAHDRHPNGYCNGIVARALLAALAPELPGGAAEGG